VILTFFLGMCYYNGPCSRPTSSAVLTAILPSNLDMMLPSVCVPASCICEFGQALPSAGWPEMTHRRPLTDFGRSVPLLSIGTTLPSALGRCGSPEEAFEEWAVPWTPN
jgi:hypothetical protein